MNLRKNSHIEVGILYEFARLGTELDAAAKLHLQDCAVCLDRLSWMQTESAAGTQEIAS